jgi:ABC-type multidrug transport system ATPase subunit
MIEAEELCDTVGFLSAGRLQATGSPEELKSTLRPGSTLDEVFAAYAEAGEGGGYKDVVRTRSTASRLH